jgi:hypothetical protein
LRLVGVQIRQVILKFHDYFRLTKPFIDRGFGRVFMVKSVKDKGKIAVKRIPHVTSKQQRKNFQVRFD